MNPLKSNSTCGLPPQIMQGIQNVKGIMNIANGNIENIAKQNPAIGQVVQMCQGHNPKDIYMNMCKQMGVDPNIILNELRK